MSKAPFMKFFPGDYLGDTMHLTTAQHGAYFLLLLAAWQAPGPLSDDDRLLARMTRLPLNQWRRMRPTILAFFECGEDGITHARVAKDKQQVGELSRKMRDNARAKSRKTQAGEPAIACQSDSRFQKTTLAPSLDPGVLAR